MKRALLLLALAGCSANETTIAMSFARAGSLYDAPFPSDDLRRDDGTVDLSKFPNPTGVDLVEQMRALVTRDARGFALAGGVFFRASAALDPASLPDAARSVAADAPVFLVGLDAGPDFMRRIPVDV
ncbi:MAG TPA: hypothetical protein VF334_15015, partial [Polyangia bacterium]